MMKDGIFHEPNFHDGLLSGVRVVDGSTLLLWCATDDEVPYLLTLSGLERLHAAPLLKGNVIFEILLHTSEFPEALVARAYGIGGDERPPWLAERLAQMREERWTLLEVTSSLGCELVAIARGTLTVQPLGDDPIQ